MNVIDVKFCGQILPQANFRPLTVMVDVIIYGHTMIRITPLFFLEIASYTTKEGSEYWLKVKHKFLNTVTNSPARIHD